MYMEHFSLAVAKHFPVTLTKWTNEAAWDLAKRECLQATHRAADKLREEKGCGEMVSVVSELRRDYEECLFCPLQENRGFQSRTAMNSVVSGL